MLFLFLMICFRGMICPTIANGSDCLVVVVVAAAIVDWDVADEADVDDESGGGGGVDDTK